MPLPSIFLEDGQGFLVMTEGGAEPPTDRSSPWSSFHSYPGEESLGSDRPGFEPWVRILPMTSRVTREPW